MRTLRSHSIASPARLAALAGLASMLVTSPAPAQNALGDGHALDANLQPGTLGRNRPVRDVEALIRFNNAVVTGNAPYGRSFRGNVGYLASEDFRASLGSNDLFVPLRESAQSQLVGGGIRGTDALQYQFSLVTGAQPPDVLSGIGGGEFRRSVTATPNSLITSGTLRSTASFLTSQALRPSLIGYSTDEVGDQVALTASPLTGVRTVPLRSSIVAPEEAGPATSLLSGLESAPRGVRGVLSTSDALSRIETARRTRLAEPEGAEEAEADLNPFARELLRSTGQREAAGTAGSTLLDRLRRRLRGELRAGEADPLAEPARPEGETKPDAEPGAPDEEGPTGYWWETEDGDANAELMRALRETRVPVQNLSSDGVVRPDAYRNHMTAGQSLLEQGRYFDAEDRFLRALSASPGDLMATVGRIHAQIGAGLYLSAAANLRRTLIDHPELVTAEYGPGLMPSAERTVEIRKQLTEYADSPDLTLAQDAALLLAYVGHHANDVEAMRTGLQRLEALTSADDASGRALLGLLKGAWQQ